MREQGPKVKNFMFHRVNPERDRLWDPIDVERFDQTVRYLSKKYRVLSVEEIGADNSIAIRSAKPLATITFDDGYRDNLEYAAPVLDRYKCPASFYIVTDCVDTGCLIWTQEIKHYLQHTNLLTFNADLSYLPKKLQVSRWRTVSNRYAYANRIRNFLVTAGLSTCQRFISDMRAAFPDVQAPQVMMNWDEVRQLRAAGHTIGSHTKSHPALPALEHFAEVESELRDSGKRIEEMLGSFPLSIAYPFGAYDGIVIATARRVGYKFGLTVNQEWYYPEGDRPFAIPRTGLVNEVWPKTLSRINGSFEKLKQLIHRRPNPWSMTMVSSNILLSASPILEACA